MQAETSTTSTWLLIDGLPDSVTADELKERFASLGTVRCAQLLPKTRQQSQLSAYVEMATHQEAQIIAEVLNGSRFLGETIRVMLVERGERLDPAKMNVDCSCEPSARASDDFHPEALAPDVCRLCGRRLLFEERAASVSPTPSRGFLGF